MKNVIGPRKFRNHVLRQEFPKFWPRVWVKTKLLFGQARAHYVPEAQRGNTLYERIHAAGDGRYPNQQPHVLASRAKGK